MSSNWDFARRLVSLDRQLDGQGTPPEGIARVQLVADNSYLTSFERAPRAMHFQHLVAPGAGNHNVMIFFGRDRLGGLPRAAVQMRAFLFNATTALLTVGLASAVSITTSGTVDVTPLLRDNDPDVAPALITGTIATGDIPAAGTPGWVPNFPGSGVNSNHNSDWWPPFTHNEHAFIVIQNGANEAINFFAVWQALRL